MTEISPAPAPATDRGGGDRFEFRLFQKVLGPEAAVLRAIAAAGPFESSCEHYVVVPGRLDANLKLRDGRLELKALMQTVGRLEQWHPEAAVPLPAHGRDLASLLASLDLPVPRAEHLFRDARELSAWLDHGRGIRVVPLRKRRQRFLLADAQAELTEVQLDGTTLASLAVESPSPAAVTALVSRLGLAGAVNTSYPRLLFRRRLAA